MDHDFNALLFPSLAADFRWSIVKHYETLSPLPAAVFDTNLEVRQDVIWQHAAAEQT